MMNLYKGNLIVDLVTAVDTNDEKTMTNQAHEAFSPELMNEIMAILGAKGYITQSIGMRLENQGPLDDTDLQLINKNKSEATEKAESVYNKANRITIDLSDSFEIEEHKYFNGFQYNRKKQRQADYIMEK